MEETGSFFEGWNADKVLSFGLNAWGEKTKQDQAAADTSTANAITRAYESAQQKQTPAPQSAMPFNPMYLAAGGAALVVVVLLLKK